MAYTAVDLTGDGADPEGPGLRAEAAAITGRTSVPAIWVAGTFLGGCNDGGEGGLLPLLAAGELDKYLDKCSPAVHKSA